MDNRRRISNRCFDLLVLVCAVSATFTVQAAARGYRFDCGTTASPVAEGYQRLTGDDMFSPDRGYGWEGAKPAGVDFKDVRKWGDQSWDKYVLENFNDLNCDGVISTDVLAFRADVADGTYRVSLLIGDMSRAIGSIDVSINGKLVAGNVAAWTPGAYRAILRDPNGWWTHVRSTVPVTEGVIRIKLSKNQSYYDQQMAEQSTWVNPYRTWWAFAPEKQPPYFYIGWPFVENSLMAIEIAPDVPPPVVGKDDSLSLTKPIASPALSECIALFNKGDFAGAVKALQGITEPEAQVAKAVVGLWLSGRLEVEVEKKVVPDALRILRQYVSSRPDEVELAKILEDAEAFSKALTIHLTRGQLGKNHFIENDKAIGWWWLIKEDSPLYYKSQLYIARAAHMLVPYFPTLGTEAEILKKLEKKFPDNRYVKYLLHWTWQPYGDGTHRDDWYMADHASKVKDAPEWVKQAYPGWAYLLDWADWIIKYKQEPEGGIGGGLTDDVEMVGALGYVGYTSLNVSDYAVPGARKLCESVWQYGGVNDEVGFTMPFADSEHSAEATGDSLGMMVQIDYGSPVWIERSMKTGKLIRDFWTSFDKNGYRRFRANHFSGVQMGSGAQMNDSWINYRAVKPAGAVIWYNGNPAAAKLFIEMADAWYAAAMSADRGKPKGVIPAEVSFPDGIVGGVNSPNWFTSTHGPQTVNYDWAPQSYKAHMHDLFLSAYSLTKDAKYLEPMRLEYELAEKYGKVSAKLTGARLQKLEPGMNDGSKLAMARWENPAATIEDIPIETQAPAEKPKAEQPKWEPGTEEWVAQNLKNVDAWLLAKRILEGRKGPLPNDITKGEAIMVSRFTKDMLKLRWPLMTSEVSATDRAAFVGIMNPFFVYTGGKFGGPLLEAAVTYENTTGQFAAMVLGTDRQGFRLLYYSMAPDVREIGICPWDLEPGAKYSLRCGPDTNDDDVMDSVDDHREFVLPQRGTPIRITVEPRKVYVVEVDQTEGGRGPSAAPDPAVSAQDISYDEHYRLVLARVHNVGSKAVQNVAVAVYDGDPKQGGTPIGTSVIPNIQAPNDLDAKVVTIGFNWTPAREAHEVYIVVDPNDEVKDEITTFNNEAHKTLPEAKKAGEPKKLVIPPSSGGRR